jgi:hypothetical protein
MFFGPKLARHALRHRAQPGFGAGKCGVADTAAYARGRAGEENASLPARQHQARRLTAGEKPGIAGQFPHFAEHPFGGVEQREIDVAADVENADLERRLGVRFAQEGGNIVLLAGIETARHDRPACGFDIGDERRKLVGITPAGENDETLGGKSFGNRCADEIPGADDGRGGVALCHSVPLLPRDHHRTGRRRVLHYARPAPIRKPPVPRSRRGQLANCSACRHHVRVCYSPVVCANIEARSCRAKLATS